MVKHNLKQKTRFISGLSTFLGILSDTLAVAPGGLEPPLSALRGLRVSRLHHGAIYSGEQGLEPQYADPESAVLPLDDSPMVALLYHL